MGRWGLRAEEGWGTGFHRGYGQPVHTKLRLLEGRQKPLNIGHWQNTRVDPEALQEAFVVGRHVGNKP